MTMKIQFITELDDVPHEVGRLIEDVDLKTQRTLFDLVKVADALQSNKIDLKDLHGHLEKMKEFVAIGIKSLTRIEDAMSILVGFYQVKTMPPEKSVEETEQTEAFEQLKQEEFSDS